jgi:hypothetical protein
MPLFGGDMIRITSSFYYELGMILHPLSGVVAGQYIDAIGFTILYPAQQRLEGLLRQQVVPVKVCAQSGWRLHSILTDLISKIGKSEQLNATDAFYLNDGLRQFEVVLNAELAQMDTYYVSQKGCYSTNHLIEQAEIMFPETIRNFMTPESVVDIRQGGRCLAFELPTASAFHFLRATESILHKYYDVISCGQTRPKTRNMGTYIDALERISGVDEKVLAVLRQIKNLHRNPIMHPEAVLEMEEALTLLGIVQSAITTMISVVKKQQKTPKEPAAPPAPRIPTLTGITPPSSIGTGSGIDSLPRKKS